MRSFLFGMLVCSLVFASSVSCKRISNSSSTPNHTWGDVAANGANFWLETSDDVYHRYVAPPGRNVVLRRPIPDLTGFLKSDNDFVKRVNLWLSVMMSAAKSTGHSIPIAHAKSIMDGAENAFAAPAHVCFQLPVVFDPEKATGNLPSLSAFNWTFQRDGSFSSRDAIEPENCLRFSVDELERRSIVQWMNRDFFTNGCKLSLETQGSKRKLIAGEKCLARRTVGSVFKDAAGFSFPLASNVLTFYTGLAKRLPKEEHFVAIMAHELAHYLRAHVVLPNDALNYYYVLGAENPQTKPERDSGLQRLGLLASRISHNTAGEPKPETNLVIAGTKLIANDYITYFSIVENLACHISDSKNVSAKRTCLPACQAVLNKYSSTLLSSPDVPVALAFERDLESCTRAFSAKNLEKPVIGLTGSVIQILEDSYLEACAAPLPEADTLWALIEHLAKKRLEKVCDQNFVFAEVRARKLGYYTSEQEADDLAAELLHKIGISPMELREANDYFAQSEDPGCERWKKLQGGSLVPVLNGYDEIHHGSCFRSLNIARELQAHPEYKSPKQPLLQPLPPDQWARMAKALPP